MSRQPSKTTKQRQSTLSKKAQLSLLVASAFISQPLLAADFTISNGQVVTTTQILNANQTGTIEAGGS